MGTLLQEFGHDIVLLYFIDKVLKPHHKNLFYMVSPATGPKLDIHFWNAAKNEYTSAFNVSQNNFIPEFNIRYTLERKVIELINKQANFRNLDWYSNISKELGKDLLSFVNNYSKTIIKGIDTLPDIIGFDGAGRDSVWVELKYEGLSKKAKDSVIKQFSMAQRRGVPFHLVIPKNPLYGREITNSWIQENLPSEMRVYKFASISKAVVPKREDIEFIEVK